MRSLSTESKASLKLLKQSLRSIWYNSAFSKICRSVKNWSVQPLLFLNPHCSSLNTLSRAFLHLFKVNAANSFCGTESREMLRNLLQSVRVPLYLYCSTNCATSSPLVDVLFSMTCLLCSRAPAQCRHERLTFQLIVHLVH